MIHLAFIHDFVKIHEGGPVDLAATNAIGEALAESNKPFVTTSGTGIAQASNGPANENDPGIPGHYRKPSEDATLALASKGVRSIVI